MNSALERILGAMGFIWGVQNSDGGIPATDRGDASGCWTTAAVIEALAGSPIFPLQHLPNLEASIIFLLKSQLASGAWPVVVGGATASTMATGQAVSALSIVSKFSETLKGVEASQVTQGVCRGLEWMTAHQDAAGGWGVEPETAAGTPTRTIATYYAAQALARTHDYDTSRSPALKRAVEMFRNTQLRNGAWPDQPSGAESLGSTARALSLIVRIIDPGSRSLLNRGLRYLRSQKHRWTLTTETYVGAGAPGQIRFHFNVLCDVARALQTSNETWSQKGLRQIAARALDAQNDDRSWPLFDFRSRDTKVSTWSTAEWLDFFLKRFEIDPAYLSDTLKAYSHMQRRNLALLIVVGVLAIIVVIWPLASLTSGMLGIVQQIWPTVPPAAKLVIAVFGFIVPTIALAILANLMTLQMQRAWSRFRGREE